jgi:hypothetical protein
VIAASIFDSKSNRTGPFSPDVKVTAILLPPLGNSTVFVGSINHRSSHSVMAISGSVFVEPHRHGFFSVVSDEDGNGSSLKASSNAPKSTLITVEPE